MQLVAHEGTDDRESGSGGCRAGAFSLVGDRKDDVAVALRELDSHRSRTVLERVLQQLALHEGERRGAVARE